MKRENGKIILSASDLMRFQGCMHATALDLEYLGARGNRGGAGKPGGKLVPIEDTETAALLQKKGDAHERAYLAEFKSAGTDVAMIETKLAGLDDQRAMTIAAMKAGKPVIFQAALFGDGWGGYADPIPFMNPDDVIIPDNIRTVGPDLPPPGMAPDEPGRERP